VDPVQILTQDEIDEYIEGVASGRYTPENIPPNIYLRTGAVLMGEVFRGFGVDWSTPDITMGDFETLASFKNNVFLFAGCKTAQQVKEVQSLIMDEAGYLRPWAQFKKLARRHFSVYNENWIRAERTAAFSLAQSAAAWKDVEEAKDLFPWMQYQTKEDLHVRQSHQILNGITRPVDDPFWNTHFPPIDWSCRCGWEQLTDEEAKRTRKGRVDTAVKEVPNPVFSFNPGKEGIIFGPSHPYFKALKSYPYLNQIIPPTPPAPPQEILNPRKGRTPSAPKVAKSKLPAWLTKEPTKAASVALDEPGYNTNPNRANIFPVLNYAEKLGDVFGQEIAFFVKDNKRSHLVSFRTGGVFPVNTGAVKDGSFASSIRFNGSNVQIARIHHVLERYSKDAAAGATGYRSKIIAHEFGHVIHEITGESTHGRRSPQLDEVVKRYKGAGKDALRRKALMQSLDTKSDQWGVPYQFGASKKTAAQVMQETEEWFGVKIEWQPGTTVDDVKEMAGAMYDSIAALTRGRMGYGHELSYWSGNFDQYELFAHAMENKFQGNPLFKAVMPELHQELSDYIDDFFKRMDKVILEYDQSLKR
jgi:SPP1 gp7 family putative phage head morphogenesis protein